MSIIITLGQACDGNMVNGVAIADITMIGANDVRFAKGANTLHMLEGR